MIMKPLIKFYLDKDVKNNPFIVYYLKNIDRRIKDENIEDIIMKKPEFERFFKKYETRIIKKIQKVIGGNWGEKEITVYLIPIGRFFSVSHPLLLKMRADFYLTTYFLIHELVHRYFYFCPEIQRYEKYFCIPLKGLIIGENMIDVITRKVSADVFGESKTNKTIKKEQSLPNIRSFTKNQEIIQEYLKIWPKNKSLIEWLKELEK